MFDVKISVGRESDTTEKNEMKNEKEHGGVNPAMFKVGPLPGEEEWRGMMERGMCGPLCFEVFFFL